MKIHQLHKNLGVCLVSLVMTSAIASNTASQLDVQKGSVTPITLEPVFLAEPQLQLPSFNNNRETVQYSRVMSDDVGLSKRASPVSEISQEYWFTVSGKQLKTGVDIDISGSQSLVRISPKASLSAIGKALTQSKLSNDLAVDLDQLEITSPNGNLLSNKNAMSFTANSKQLSSTGFAKGTSAFKFDKSMSMGRFQLKTNQSLPDSQSYLINVLEKNSPYKLDMQLADQQVIAGEKLSAKLSLDYLGDKITLEQTQAKIVSPDGRVFPARLKANKQGELVLQRTLNLPFASSDGLWELQISTMGIQRNQTIRRNSKLAFAFQPKTAKVGQSANRITANKSGVSYSVNVNASHAGRYEVTGLLYVVGGKGSKRLIAQARTAKWVEPGNENISLLFKSSILPMLKKGERFEVSKIGLNDQSRMTALQ